MCIFVALTFTSLQREVARWEIPMKIWDMRFGLFFGWLAQIPNFWPINLFWEASINSKMTPPKNVFIIKIKNNLYFFPLQPPDIMPKLENVLFIRALLNLLLQSFWLVKINGLVISALDYTRQGLLLTDGQSTRNYFSLK